MLRLYYIYIRFVFFNAIVLTNIFSQLIPDQKCGHPPDDLQPRESLNWLGAEALRYC